MAGKYEYTFSRNGTVLAAGLGCNLFNGARDAGLTIVSVYPLSSRYLRETPFNDRTRVLWAYITNTPFEGHPNDYLVQQRILN